MEGHRESEIRTALLISGGGTTAEAVIKACHRGTLQGINPVVVVSSRRDAPGIGRVEALEVPSRVVSPSEYGDSEEFEDALLTILQESGTELVSQNGWLVRTPTNVIDAYGGRVINQHPGPLYPGGSDFGGKGMYGARVTCARIAYLANLMVLGQHTPEGHWTETTVHHVTPEYDEGPLIRVDRMFLTDVVPIEHLEALVEDPQLIIEATRRIQEQLLPIEHEVVMDTLRAFALDNVPKFERPGELVPDSCITHLDRAKQLAISLFPNR